MSDPTDRAPAITWTCPTHGALTLKQVYLHA